MPDCSQSDDYARGKLSGKQFFVTHVQVILRDRKRLAHHASNRILCSSTFQWLGMGQKHGRHQFHFSHKQKGVHYLYLTRHCAHQTKRVFAAHQLYLYADFVQHIAFLEEYVGMYATHHVKHVTLSRNRASFGQATVASIVRKIHGIHSAGLVLVVQRRRKLRRLCVFATAFPSWLCTDTCWSKQLSAYHSTKCPPVKTDFAETGRPDQKPHRQAGSCRPAQSFWLSHYSMVFPKSM